MVIETQIKCNRCGSMNYTKAGWAWRQGIKSVQRYRCRDCGKIYVLSNGNTKNKNGGVSNATA